MGNLALVLSQPAPEPGDWESALIEEARAIVAGQSAAAPRVDHLAVLLAWLDGAATLPQPFTAAPF